MSREEAPVTLLLALDAGGTSTRAVVVDADPSAGSVRVLGFGRSGGGNPTARGIDSAAAAIAAAAAQAYRAVPGNLSEGLDISGVEPGPATLAMAGQQTADFARQVAQRLISLGWPSVTLTHDLLAAFTSGTPDLDGYALIAGTGSVAARVRSGELDQVVGGRGWLLGDAGSGFWIGHQVARAVVAALDGQGDDTVLVRRTLDSLGIRAPGAGPSERIAALRALMDVLYAQPPVQLATLAPLPFAVPDDPVARHILVTASTALAELVRAVQIPELAGPVVVGGSVVVQGLLTAGPQLRRDLAPIGSGAVLLPVSDGVLGATVLALRGAGMVVDAAQFDRLSADIEAARLA